MEHGGLKMSFHNNGNSGVGSAEETIESVVSDQTTKAVKTPGKRRITRTVRGARKVIIRSKKYSRGLACNMPKNVLVGGKLYEWLETTIFIGRQTKKSLKRIRRRSPIQTWPLQNRQSNLENTRGIRTSTSRSDFKYRSEILANIY